MLRHQFHDLIINQGLGVDSIRKIEVVPKVKVHAVVRNDVRQLLDKSRHVLQT